MTERVLYLVTCGAPLAERAGDGIRAARDRGWRPRLVPTDASMPWVERNDLGGVEVLRGHRDPSASKRFPAPDAVAVVPATFNTISAWANGAANTYPLVTLCSALGAKVPTVTVPFAKHDLAGHPAWLASLAVLRRAGIQLIDPSSGAVGAVHPIASGTGEQITQAFQWSWVMDCLDRISGGSSSSPVKQPGDASSS